MVFLSCFSEILRYESWRNDDFLILDPKGTFQTGIAMGTLKVQGFGVFLVRAGFSLGCQFY